MNDAGIAQLLNAGEPEAKGNAASLLKQLNDQTSSLLTALSALQSIAQQVESSATERLASVTENVQTALVAAGRGAGELNQFDAFARAAQHFDSFKAVLDEKNRQRDEVKNAFNEDIQRRDSLVETHRATVRAICEEVAQRFDGRVLVAVEAEGRNNALENWLLGLRNPGITRWWNSGGSRVTTPAKLRKVAKYFVDRNEDEALTQCRDLGMSAAVSSSFFEQLAPWSRQLEIWALRSPDKYRIRWVENSQEKDIDDLSGGRKVAVLLSLILESDDNTPLFIDQPEDQLDNRFLNETIIPALHRLKGKRQVVFATHSANLVVNGDADQVIVLEADANQGRVDTAGAIEMPPVKEAILRTLDGGEDAFGLRRKKYGY